MTDVTDMELQNELQRLKNGENVHFQYGTPELHPNNSSNKKKKKKKKKHASSQLPQLSQVELHQPEADYPSLRVIKQGPNGDVIVESLDEPVYQSGGAEYSQHHSHNPSNDPSHNHNQNHNNHSHNHNHSHSHSHSHNHSHRHRHYHTTSIWDNLTYEEQENLKQFWEQLDEAQKLELVKIDKDSIMELFKNETKKEMLNNAHNHSNCSCSHCGKRLNIIEDELEYIYDNHFDDIINFIHEIRDINDLNALPGLLFGGFHMLDEEHRMQKRRERIRKLAQTLPRRHQESYENSAGMGEFVGEDVNKVEEVVEEDEEEEDEDEEIDDDVIENAYDNDNDNGEDEFGEVEDAGEVNTESDSKADDVDLRKSFATNFLNNLSLRKNLAALSNGSSTSNGHVEEEEAEIDPKLFEAIDNFRNKIGEDKLADLLEKLSSVREIIGKLHKADKVELDKGMAFLKQMGKYCGFLDDNNKVLSSFADSLLKNLSLFIEMMEELSDSRTKREDLLKDITKSENKSLDEIDDEEPIALRQAEFAKIQEIVHEEVESDSEYPSTSGYVDQHNHMHDLIDQSHEEQHEHDEYSEDELDESDTESEISEEEKMQEIRRLFLIQVIKLFQMRLKVAYKEQLSQDRTKKLIEELEAEENAKKEREMKKLKQKEKAKEKKRLQQLAKEEEKKKKEEEEKAKELELKKKQDELRAQQMKRKEDARIKREEEKKKRIEELKKKELELKKKQEVQKKKEEEAKKLKEEKKKKADQERKEREEKAEMEKQKAKLELEEKKMQEQQRLQQEAQKFELEAESLLREQNNLLESQILQLQLQLQQQQPQHALNDPRIIPDPLATLPNSAAPDLLNTLSSSSEPASNPLLDQLYRAKPRNSISSQSGFGMLPSMSSANSNNILNGVGWENNQIPQIPGTPHQTRNSFFAPPAPVGSNGVPPIANVPGPVFNGGIGTMGSLDSNNFNPTASLPSLNQWNPISTSRNGLIWGNNSSTTSNSSGISSNLWGQLANPASLSSLNLVNTNPASQGASNVLSSSANSTPLIPSVPLSVGGGVPGVAGTSGAPVRDSNDLHIQQAILQAYHILSGNQQLEFGLAPTVKLFLLTQSVLGNNYNLSMNQFMMACRNSSGPITFDFVYDDVGTVTHIKVNLIGVNGGVVNSNGRLSTSEIRSGMGIGAFNQGSSLW